MGEIEKMVNDAEKFKADDEKQKDKISDDDRKAINDKSDEAIKWLDANQLAEVEEFNAKQKEVEAVCNPIITKLYGAAGGAPGGMPDMGAWEVQEELHLELAKEEQAQPLRRLTKSFLRTIVFSWNSNAFMLHFVWNSLEKLNKFYVV